MSAPKKKGLAGPSTPKTKRAPKPKVEDSPSILRYCIVNKRESGGMRKTLADMIDNKAANT